MLVRMGDIIKDKDFGLIINGLDTLDPSKIIETICERRFICFKNKTIVPPKELVSFYKSIGNVHKQDEKFMSDEYIETYSEGFRELIPVRNKDISGYGENGLFAGDETGEIEWHCANQNRVYSEEITAFSIRQMGDTGGALCISDNRSPYYEMPENFRFMLDDIDVSYEIDDFEWSTEDTWNALEFKSIDGKKLTELQTDSKPLVLQHPIDHVKGLHYSWPIIKAYHDYDEEEFQHIHRKILNYILQDKYLYSHNWEVGDVILNEQYHSLHRRDTYTGDRLLYRSAIYLNEEDR